VVKYLLIILIISNSLVGGILKKIYSSYNYKYEVGVDYPFSQTLKFQDELISSSHRIDFHNETSSAIPSLYFSMKSKAFSIYDFTGLYLNSTFRYSFFDKQRGLFTDGTVVNDEVDLKTSVHILSLNLMPSVFLYYNFGEISGKNTVVFEMFAGVGTTFYFGKVQELFYPTLEEFQNEQNGSNEMPSNFQINEQGLIAYIGETEDLGFGFGINLNYGVKLKYIYQDFNFHIIYRVPTVLTTGEYLNLKQILIGLGYSF